MAVQDLLGAILGQDTSKAQGADLDDLVGGVLGGLIQGGAQPQQTQQGGGLLGGLIGGLLGGQSASGGILGSLLGGAAGGSLNAAGIANNPLLAGISNTLAERLGVEPAVAQSIVAFAAVKLLPLLLDAVQGRGGNLDVEGDGLDLDDLLGRMGGHQGLDHDFLEQSGLAANLSAQTGLDEDTAEEGLRQTLFMLGDAVTGGELSDAQEQQGGLDHLLDSFE